ncbi:MAG: hypothetical protein PHF67_03310 [Candidatus Nanoarchaeia archaeon]|nr:hypothetical protein [Candidatus Nanoarchaeia archaeon]
MTLGQYYANATICFPESFNDAENKFEVNKGSISQGNISFTRNGFLISAQSWPFVIPFQLSDNELVQEQIVKPTIETVVSDIKTIDGLFDQLRQMSRAGLHSDRFYYSRESPVSPTEFRVYDYSHSGGQKLFSILMNFKGLPATLLARKYQQFARMATWIRQEDYPGVIPYVRGRDLKHATERAIRIYGFADEIKGIRFEK